MQRAAEVPSAGAQHSKITTLPGAICTNSGRLLPAGRIASIAERGPAMTLPRRSFLCLAGAAIAGLSAPPPARADDYPTRSVTIVVPFTPAGSTDIVARMLAQKLEQRLGKS